MGKPAIDLSKLTAGEKYSLIDDLWGGLEEYEQEPSSAHLAELGSRLDRLERTRLVGVAWEDVRAEMRTGKP